MRRSNGNHGWIIVRLYSYHQRTTRWIIRIGPLSIIRAIDWLWPSLNLEGLPWRVAIQQPVGPTSVEPQHLVPEDLRPDTTDRRRIPARRTVVDRGKCQQLPDLRPILGILHQPPAAVTRRNPPKRYRYGEPSLFATHESEPHRFRNLEEVSSEIGR